ncbi:MAG: hypothetical protein ACPGVL_03645 [Pseudoalteromonas spongiae]|uniref:hypothetical protein n=1 Tax=Pseudoalteromonas TaxID=53246 RepID=UPI00026CDEBB|nr:MULTISPECIES: hypothetical protein [Pseudoalteromonas]MEC8328210.1 hypothetical protein [Pseudomonadota bacterium]ATD00069.1 hypothetical protein PSPO_a3237 [Pseudoalteromonas spongiae UST010723-006]KPV96148.1 hypothetical protein AN214_01745 [Pseudoalteromonas sp. P1-9]MCF6458338.1 hypothetical protein [Pseudoalteromonas sp. MMG024]MDE3272682.1 hypothetical protein [Pseudoalteromonas sp. G4]
MLKTYKLVLAGQQIRLTKNDQQDAKLYINGQKQTLIKQSFKNRTNYLAKLEKMGDFIISQVTTRLGQEIRFYLKSAGQNQLLFKANA